jgi:hypothetical protein
MRRPPATAVLAAPRPGPAAPDDDRDVAAPAALAGSERVP